MNPIQANIKDNKPYCSKCGELLGQIKDYFLVEDSNGNRFLKFIRRCKCGQDNYYYEFMTMQGDKRFRIEDENDIKIVKE